MKYKSIQIKIAVANNNIVILQILANLASIIYYYSHG